MLFHTLTFFVFFAAAFTLYWGVGRQHIKMQNLIILIASYVFYGWWDWRFCGLIALSSIIDYQVGLQLLKNENQGTRKGWLYVSLAANLGMLFVFKYCNFFIESFNSLLELAHSTDRYNTLNIILPVGISFYTFQTLSYTIDVYRRKIEPCQSIVDFFAYVSFFPQLVAGPIERASHLLPQFARSRELTTADISSSLYLITWGFFKKLVIADTSGTYADAVFNNYSEASSVDLISGAVFFAFQIYGDFSGYSSIARGVSRLFGFDLMVNFSYPYFSRNVAEFWRRWHISLSTWFRDYIYIPLGGNKVSQSKAVRNITIVFLVSGFWHGANWTFIVWGGIHVLLYLPLFLGKSNRKFLGDKTSITSFPDLMGCLSTFAVVCLAWVFFRSDTIQDAVAYLGYIFTNINNSSVFLTSVAWVWALILVFSIMEYLSQGYESVFLARVSNTYLRRISICIVAIGAILFSQLNTSESFIYFQF